MATSEPLQPAGGEHGGTKRLNALRRGEGMVFDDAYLGLRRELEAYARAAAGARAGEADFQPESIVADALARGMGPALAACDDDEHLAGWLKVAVRHELLDRIDKRKPGSLPEGSRGGMAEPSDQHVGPATEALARDSAAFEQAALDRLLKRLDSEPMTPNDRTLIDLYVIERLPWEEIAHRTGREAGALRVAMNRLRDRLLPKLFAPIKPRLDAPTWAVAEAILIRRLHLAKATEDLGLDPVDLRRALMEGVFPAVIEQFGGASTEMLLRLTGFRRA
jgi:DNA-directed RNA polymerase specialized sigma24 family protein